MQRCFLILFLFICQSSFGQSILFSASLPWFEKADKSTIQAYFQGADYKLLSEKDSSGLHLLHYSYLKTENGIQPQIYLVYNDTVLETISFEIYNHNEHKNVLAQLKANKFKTLNADVNGDFITTTFDNDRFLVHQDYQALENPIGKGEIPNFRFRIFRKYGKFDTMNGTKYKIERVNGQDYVVIETYKNGVLDGERITYYPDQKVIKKKENYRSGRLNGTVTDFDQEGLLRHSSVHSYHWKYGMEKWYDEDGKIVKSLQWQRDVPVGTEKYTFNGKSFIGATYVKGKKQGLASFPVDINWSTGYSGHSSFAFPVDLNWGKDQWMITSYLAIETVNFIDDIKSGKAIGISPFSNDTLYTCYYKNGILDSLFTTYQVTYLKDSMKNVPVGQTTFVNGLENGKRTMWFRSGQYKDSVSYEENYINGKLNGTASWFYNRNENNLQDFYWYPCQTKLNFVNGILSGPYSEYQDSDNYQYCTYLNGELDGKLESSERNENTWVKAINYYDKGARTGEWVTTYVLDSTVVTEHFSADKKVGTETKVVKGKLVEERYFDQNNLEQINYFEEEKLSRGYRIKNAPKEKFSVTETLINGDTTRFFTYQFPNDDYPKSDTLLATIAADLFDSESLNTYLDGEFIIETKDYKRTGVLLETTVRGEMIVYHKKEAITEKIDADLPINYSYSTADSQPYSGIFYSSYSREKISVKDGVRNGWCIEYDENHNEIRRTKYKTGVAKKTIAKE